MDIDVVIFDLDHTLVCSDHLPGAWLDALVEFGATASAAQSAYEAGIGQSGIVTAQHCFPNEPDIWKQAHHRCHELSMERLNLQAMPGSEQLLGELHARAIPIVLSTGASNSWAENVISRMNWEQYFYTIYGSTAENTKHHHIQHLFIENQSFQPARSVSIGDGVMEIQAATQQNIKLRIGLQSHNGARNNTARLRSAGATHLVDSLFDVAPLLQMSSR